MSNISYQQNQTRLLVVTDSEGTIIALAGETDENTTHSQFGTPLSTTGLKALPGQVLHSVEMPPEFLRHRSAMDRHRWLSLHRVTRDEESRLVKR